MEVVAKIKKDLESKSDAEKAAFFPRFFKAGKGEYAEGDQFIGVIVPEQRIIAKKYYQQITLDQVEELLSSPIHEYRLTALFMLVLKFKKAKKDEREQIYRFYLSHTDRINNWDLVDSSAYSIVGPYLLDKDRKILYELARSKSLWEQRISIIATKAFISKGDVEDTFALAEIFLKHEHDLIHKAVGWMLREAGKKDIAGLRSFLKKYAQVMPRTMLRYAIEKISDQERKRYLA